MIKNTALAVAFLGLSCFAISQADAAHSSLNPMAPRQISTVSSTFDYTYGYTVLPGGSIDSFEWISRNIGWNFNYNIFDKYLLRPVAHGYAKLPKPVQSGVGNFFQNLSELNNIVNNAVLGEFGNSGLSLGRFAINSTVGLLGLVDVASYMGMPLKEMEMSTVLGRYGASQGFYLMVPFMGPESERALQGMIIDNWPYYLWATPFASLALWSIDGIHKRASFNNLEDQVDNAVDPYLQLRQIYLMYAQGKVDPDAAMHNSEDSNIDDALLDEIDNY